MSALDVVTGALEDADPDVETPEEMPTYEDLARCALVALGANGYVVVPRHLLDELTDTLLDEDSMSDIEYKDIRSLAAAVVEAVGPTREDTR